MVALVLTAGLETVLSDLGPLDSLEKVSRIIMYYFVGSVHITANKSMPTFFALFVYVAHNLSQS